MCVAARLPSGVMVRRAGGAWCADAQTHQKPGQIAFSRDGLLFFQCIGNGVEVRHPGRRCAALGQR